MSGRRDGCTGKRRHADLGAAVRVLKKLKNAGLSPYPCRRCKGWHIGNSNRPDKIVARIDQLLARG